MMTCKVLGTCWLRRNSPSYGEVFASEAKKLFQQRWDCTSEVEEVLYGIPCNSVSSNVFSPPSPPLSLSLPLPSQLMASLPLCTHLCRYSYAFGNQDPTFNAGIFGINLELWHKWSMTLEIEYWMQEHRLRPLWRYGTQPLMLIALHGQWAELDTRWNLDGGLGVLHLEPHACTQYNWHPVLVGMMAISHLVLTNEMHACSAM